MKAVEIRRERKYQFKKYCPAKLAVISDGLDVRHEDEGGIQNDLCIFSLGHWGDEGALK